MSESGQRAACTLCGKTADSGDIVFMLDCLVCARCKPMALQRIREGMELPPPDLPRLAFSALSPEGKAVTDQVAAASALAARDLLIHRGYRNVVLHEDDAALSGSRLFSQTKPSGARPRDNVGARDRVRLGRARTVWPAFLMLVRKTWIVWGIGLLLILIGLPVWGGVVLGMLFLALVWAVLPLAAYQRLIVAVEDARWDQVPEAARRIRRVNRITPAKVPEFELVFREAEAHAATDRLEKALEMMAPFEGDPKVERWMYCNRVAALHGLAKEDQGRILWLERAAEAAPENFSVIIDLAMVVARKGHDPVRARHLLDRALELPSSDLVGHAVPLCRGLIALEEGCNQEAVEHLLQAEEAMRPNLDAFFMPLFDNLSRACRALALARLGDRETARRLYGETRRWMEAWRETELLEALNRELGGRQTDSGISPRLRKSDLNDYENSPV